MSKKFLKAAVALIAVFSAGALIPAGAQASTISVTDLASGKVTVLTYVKANGLSKKEIKHSKKVIVVPPGTPFTNSGLRGAPGLGWFTDTKGAVLCQTGKGPTGWQKCGLRHKGDSGNCANYAAPPNMHLNVPLIQGRVVVVKTSASVRVSATAQAYASVQVRCSDIVGYIVVSATSSATVSFKEYIQAKGSVYSKAYGQAAAEAKAKITISVNCTAVTPIVVTPTPPPCSCQVPPVCKDCTPPPCDCTPPSCTTNNTCMPPPCSANNSCTPPTCQPGSNQPGCKNGTQTPPTTTSPGPTPGPNPAPNGGATDPGNNQCYDAQGFVVAPVNGACPVVNGSNTGGGTESGTSTAPTCVNDDTGAVTPAGPYDTCGVGTHHGP